MASRFDATTFGTGHAGSPTSRTRLIAGLCASFCIAGAAGAAGAAGEPPAGTDFFVSETVVPHVLDVDLRQVPPASVWKPGDPIFEIPERLLADYGVDPDPDWVDPLRQVGRAGAGTSAELGPSFGGLSFAGGTPPDTVGDVGPDHYIQMVNSSRFAIWNKAGVPVVPETDLSDLWTGGGSPCADGDGDPIVLYDELADRWLMTEFDLSGNTFCIYVSQTPDPVAGGWFVYDFSAPSFPDYPKYGVWPDAYYVSSYEPPSLGIYAFDRASMLAGAPATFQRFAIPQLVGTASRVTRILPADADDSPPAGAPNYFARTVDDTQDSSNPVDRIEIWEYVVDFATPANSSFTLASSLTPAPLTLFPCSPGSRDCVPQPGTAVLIDVLFNRAMRRLQYRNFGTHASMLLNQVVDVGGAIAGQRWWELRKVGAGAWAIHQEGTYSPDSVHRFMGSMAMNAAGEIALGYSVTDAVSVLPGIRATARRASDPAGTMTLDELTIIDGVGVQTISQRWGDYSSMNVDPSDGLTFWYTSEYIQANGLWTTHVGSFSLVEIFADGFESGDATAWSSSTP